MVNVSKIVDKIADKLDGERPKGVELSPRAVAYTLEKQGFLRSIAGDDFDRVVDALVVSNRDNKGILFTGGNGCGKTLLLNIVWKCTPTRSKRWFSCNEACDMEEINRCTCENESVFIDDFGGERLVYGDNDVVGAFIVQWHDIQMRKRQELGAEYVPRVMHITTNLSGVEIMERCGGRVFDRLKDLVVICKLEGESKRKQEVVK